MELRNHPLIARHGRPSWPPVWTRSEKNGNRTLRAEVGVLKHVHASTPQVSNKCYLVIEHEEEKYVGCLAFDDVAFCKQITGLLRLQIGRSIKEIGDLDLSGTL